MTEPAERYDEKPLVYVAGPYTNPDPVQNTHDVIVFASSLIDEGLVTPVVPHLTLLWHLVSPHPLDFWYEYDVAILKRCDAIFRMPGASTGADREVEYAREHGLPVFTDRSDLNNWASGQKSATS